VTLRRRRMEALVGYITMRLTVAAVSLLACGAVGVVGSACGHNPPPAPMANAATPAQGVCAGYVYQVLSASAPGEGARPPMVTAYDAASAAAETDVDAANQADAAHDPLTAAHKFLDCAHRFRQVPPGDPMESDALAGAQVCDYDAIYAFANAGRFAREGR